MFTLALASFASHRYYLKFQSPLLTGDFERKAFDFTKKSTLFFFPTKSTDNYYMCHALSVKLIGFLALQHTFSLVKKKMYWKLVQKTYSYKTEFPDFSPTLPISKIFPDFLKNSPTFPWHWNIFVFPWPWQPWSSKPKTRGQRLTENYSQSQLTPWISRVK